MLVLHWVMMAMEAQWAAIYHIGDKGLYRVAKSSSAAKGGQTLFDFLGDTPETDMAMSLAARAMRMRTIVATSARSRQQVEILRGSALATPLLDEDMQAIGCIVLLCEDENRNFSANEQQLMKYCAPMFTLHAQRARLHEQAAWLASLSSEDATHAQKLADKVGKVVTELREAHAAQLEQKKLEWEREREQIQLDHEKGLKGMQLELQDARERLGASQAVMSETVEALLAHKADPSARDADGASAIEAALEGGHVACAQKLAAGGAPLSERVEALAMALNPGKLMASLRATQ